MGGSCNTYDVMLHLVIVYIGLNCTSLPVVLVFEAEQSNSHIHMVIIALIAPTAVATKSKQMHEFDILG